MNKQEDVINSNVHLHHHHQHGLPGHHVLTSVEVELREGKELEQGYLKLRGATFRDVQQAQWLIELLLKTTKVRKKVYYLSITYINFKQADDDITEIHQRYSRYTAEKYLRYSTH